MAGFAGALALGVDALECDVMLTADAHVVVTHDPRLDPDLARSGDGQWIDAPAPAVRDLTFDELRTFDVGRLRPGSALAAAFPRQHPVDHARVPLLGDVLALVARTPVLLDVELKTEPGETEDLAVALAGAVVAELAHWPAQRIALRSFDWRGLLAARRLRPALAIGFLSEGSGLRDLASALPLARPGDLWAPCHEDLTAAMVARAHAARLRVEPWTVNDPSDMRRLVAAGVDGLCTDDPDVARDVLRGLGLPLPPPLKLRPDRRPGLRKA